VDFFRGVKWDIVGKMKIWFTISAVVIIAGLVAWGTRGLNYGIDFTGGSLLRYEFASPLAETEAEVPQVLAKVREVLRGMDLAGSQIQVVTDDEGRRSQLFLRTPPVANDEEAARRDTKVVAGLKEVFAAKGEILDLGRESVGPVVGVELRNKALLSLCLGSLFIVIYITIRYEFRFAMAGIAALIHDGLFTTGAVALVHVEINSAFVAAMLTILGYSINDSVVIFDRIRENMRLHRRTSFAETVNESLLQTMARSVNTMLTVVFSALALYLLGGEALRGFSLALIFGMTTGCYSSIFFASPLLVLWERRADRKRSEGPAPARAGGTGGRQRARAEAPAEVLAEEPSESPAPANTAIEKLQREEMDERRQKLDEEQELKREERRTRRQKEKARKAKKGGKKRRF
jgi:preprotein translocase subunit SecF